MSSVSADVANQLRFVNTYGMNGSRTTGQNQYVPVVGTQQPAADNYNGKTTKGGKPKFDYSIDDGKISFGDKMKNFAKGLVSPVTSMFKSPKNFIIGAATIAASAALLIGTGGAAAPFMVALGVTGGGIKFVSNAIKAGRAKTDEDARKAWRGMGAGTISVVGSVAAAKPALRAAGVETEGMSAVTATINCFKQAPNSVRNSIATITSGEFVDNIRGFFNREDYCDWLDEEDDDYWSNFEGEDGPVEVEGGGFETDLFEDDFIPD